MYAGGVQADQPDLLFIGWLRMPQPGGPADPGRWGFINNAAQFFYLQGADSNTALYARSNIAPKIPAATIAAGPSGLVQVGVSRTEMFVNGQKYANLSTGSIASYDTFMAAMNGSTATYFLLNEVPTTTSAATAKWYRLLVEDFAVSGRTALEAVQADYEYVSNFAGFVDVV